MIVEKILPLLALAAMAPQCLLMTLIGYPYARFIGYPHARKSPEAMEAFRKSGFLWYMVTLALIVLAGLWVRPRWFGPMEPSTHSVNLLSMSVALISGLFLLLLVELVYERLVLGKVSSPKALKEQKRYDDALPAQASSGARLYVLLCLLAVLEVMVFHAIGLGGLWHQIGLDKPFAAGICAVAFGLSHCFYGWRQMAVKTIDGSILAWVALSAGWLVAALALVLLSIVLTAISQHRASRPRCGKLSENGGRSS